MKKILKIMFIFLYIVGVMYILFLRNHIHRFWTNLSLIEYFKYSSNFIPLKTIVSYVLGYLNSKFTLLIVIKNILGNLVLFIPAGIILGDCLKHYTNKWMFFLILTCFFVILEVIQGIFRVGFFDIDDIILYFIGFVIGIQLRATITKAVKK